MTKKIRSHFLVRIIALVIIAGAVALATYWAFFTPAAQQEAVACPVREIALQSPDGSKEVRVVAEMAITPAQMQTGLMNRKSLPAKTGMMFVWDEPRQIYMWMKNTYIPLDMIFINGQEVVGIINAKNTQDETPLTVKSPADKVLEVNYGFTRAEGISKGWYVTVGPCVTR